MHCAARLQKLQGVGGVVCTAGTGEEVTCGINVGETRAVPLARVDEGTGSVAMGQHHNRHM